MADLSVTAKASHNPIATGSRLIYTVAVSNDGPSQAEAMIDVNNSLAAGTKIISISSSRSMLCTTESRDLTGPMNCSFFRLAPQDSVSVTYIVEVNIPPGSVLTNTVTVAINSASIIDPNPSNNSATVSTQVFDARCTIAGTQNISVVGEPSLQCGAVVSYPAPVSAGACREVKCTPISGTLFAPGAVTGVCTATDDRGVSFVSTFNVSVAGLPLVSFDKTSFDLGPVNIRRKPVKHPPSEIFTIENSGCDIYSVFLGLSRTGSDVDSGKISNPFDGQFFSLSLINSDGTETPRPIECNVECPLTVRQGEKKSYRILFTPKIPAVSSATVGLSAEEVLPDVVTATLRLGGSSAIQLTGRVSTAVKLINPVKPKKAPFIGFTRSGSEFLVEYSIYDSNLDVDRARIQFLDSAGRSVGKAFDFDLAPILSSRNLVRGQSFTVSQRFPGAKNQPKVAGARVTVFDAESSEEASSLP
jgi:uncharacterized repeat protein (TIGR01451 family)